MYMDTQDIRSYLNRTIFASDVLDYPRQKAFCMKTVLEDRAFTSIISLLT